MINYNNSTAKQKAHIDRMIEQDIYCNINDIVDRLEIYEYLENECIETCRYCGAENEEECECGSYDGTYNEPLEFYFVSKWLADRLYEIGEPVVRQFTGKAIWGRTCSGQAIALDDTFWEVFQDGVQNA